MIGLSSYLAFLAASMALILLPGPSQALVLARTLSGGMRAGALTAVGLNIGTLFHAAAAALGLSALLATSALAFAIVKYVGAAYLVLLGIQALRTRRGAAPVSAQVTTRASLGQAIAAGILNPKVAIFFLAFLPQFVDPARGNVFAQFMIYGATMAVLDTFYELMLVQVFARTRRRFADGPRASRWRNRITGTVLIGLGARLAVQER